VAELVESVRTLCRLSIARDSSPPSQAQGDRSAEMIDKLLAQPR
jgi:hypothetical protein